MRTTHLLYMAALLVFAAPAFSADEPAPAAPEKSEKAEAERKKEPPLAQNTDKKDGAAPTAAAPAGVGKGPKFPLESEWFIHIADIMPDDKNVGDVEEAQQLELHALEDILIALQASSDAHLKASITPSEALFKSLMRGAEKFRGHVVQRRGLLEVSERFPIPDNKSGISELYRGQISSIYGEIFTFLSIERPNPDLIKHPARLTGVFMKRYAYKNRLAGEKQTWTPLLIVKNVEAYSESDAPATPMSNLAKMAIVMVVVLLLGRLAFRVTSVQAKTARGNPFGRANRKPSNKPGAK